MPGCGSGVVVLPWSSPRSQHHAAMARKKPLIPVVQISGTTSSERLGEIWKY